MRIDKCFHLLLLTMAPSWAATPQQSSPGTPLHFEPSINKGVYTARGQGFFAQISADGLELLTPAKRIPMRWRGANAFALQPVEKLQGISNYLLGSDSGNWRTGVPHFGRLEAKQVYPGTDLVLYSSGQSLEFDFVLQPGTDASRIEMDFGDASTAAITAAGDLSLDKALAWKKPFAYQKVNGLACPVKVRYERRASGRFGFAAGAYDRTRELVIDPALTFSTYFGGALGDQINAMAVDASGNVFIAGGTFSPNLPGTAPASGNGSQDIFVAKLNSSGNSILYSTIIGGSGLDVAKGLAVDASGTVFVVGQTASTNFPVSANAPQPKLNGGSAITDAFALRLNAAGNQVLYSTYIGGPLSDLANAVAIDAAGNAFVVGQTQSLSFPAATNPGFPARGGTDAFVTKIAASGESFEFSLFLGGFGFDEANAVAVDASGAVYVAGETRSQNFPVTNGVFQPAINGSADAFLTKLTNSGQLVYSTYFGGSLTEFARGLAVDGQGFAYITGSTISTNLPIAGNPYQPAMSQAPDGFVTKINQAGTGLVYSTFLGGTVEDSPYAITLDASNNAYIVGETDRKSVV